MSKKKVTNVIFVGPSPKDMGGYQKNTFQENLSNLIYHQIKNMKSDNINVITDLSLGISTWAAEAAKALGVPYTVYQYCGDISSRWPADAKEVYRGLLEGAAKVTTIHDGEWEIEAFKKTKDQMLTDADTVFHSYPMGDYTVNRAEKLGKKVEKIMPSDSEDDHFVSF